MSEANQIFRKKNIQAMESPEELDNYLKVTSPGMWLLLAVVIILLAGIIIWGIFGTIESCADVAVVSQNGEAYCVVPYEKAEDILSSGIVTVDDVRYSLSSSVSQPYTIDESVDVLVRIAGNYQLSDVVVCVSLNDIPPEGVYSGTVITDSLTPISLLLQ